jgi:hypothetical protein
MLTLTEIVLDDKGNAFIRENDAEVKVKPIGDPLLISYYNSLNEPNSDAKFYDTLKKELKDPSGDLYFSRSICHSRGEVLKINGDKDLPVSCERYAVQIYEKK